jgi:Tfp pilus assembly protein PilF
MARVEAGERMSSSNLTARMYVDQGRAALQAEKLNDAADHFRMAVETDPQYEEAYRFLAETYEKLGYAHRARKAWESLLRITKDPKTQEQIREKITGFQAR